MPTIRNVRAIVTRPDRWDLVIVKLETSEPGLTGLGCATFTQRSSAVADVIKTWLEPLLRGRDVSRVRELWRLMHTNGYWRGGPILNNAISGVDQALWDIKGKLAHMPVYDLLGGKVREAAPIYRHAAGADNHKLLDAVHALLETGVRHVRAQVSGYGGSAYAGPRPDGALPGAYYDPDAYRRQIIDALEHLRTHLPEDVHLLHDVHSRLHVDEACELARQLEPFHLFFLEDLVPPEHLHALPRIRALASTPLALGELFVDPAQWQPLLRDGLIDFLRCHVSAIGGITPAWAAAQVCEATGVRTAWHGPKDTSPVGHAANLHLDLASDAFGIQEFVPFTDAEHDVFPGLPTLRGGLLYPNDKPGLGVEIDEDAAARFPPQHNTVEWTQSRRPDGSLFYP